MSAAARGLGLRSGTVLHPAGMLRAPPIVLTAACVLVALAGSVRAGQPLQLTTPEVVHVAPGWFQMGSDDDAVAHAVSLCEAFDGTGLGCALERFAVEQPLHRTYLDAFRIDRTEVSHAAYRRCVLDNVCAPCGVSDEDVRLGHSSHPAVGLRWHDAQRYCEWVGGRLPTEAEWERAARGRDLRRFPWGRHYNSRLANHGGAGGQPSPEDGHRFAAPVDSYPDGRGPLGLRNLAGNVWELTASRFVPYPGAKAPIRPELAAQRVMRGGSWRAPVHALRVTHREPIGEREPRPDVGFRCAYNTP